MPRPISYAVFCLKKKTPAPRAFGSDAPDGQSRPPLARPGGPAVRARGHGCGATPTAPPRPAARTLHSSRWTGIRHHPNLPTLTMGPGRNARAGEEVITLGTPVGLQNSVFFFFNDTAPTEIYTLSLHDALPILRWQQRKP